MGVIKTGPAFEKVLERIRKDISLKTGREMTKKDAAEILGTAALGRDIRIFISRRKRRKNAFQIEPIFQI